MSIDVNECTDSTHSCSHACINTVGSYNCSCPNGMKLGTDSKTCAGKLIYIIVQINCSVKISMNVLIIHMAVVIPVLILLDHIIVAVLME